MKKVLSLFILVLLVVGIFSVVPASAQTYTEINCPKLTKIADLDQKVNDGTAKGIFIENMKEDTKSNVYKLIIPVDSYVFIEYGGVATQWTTPSIKDIYGNISIYSDINLTKAILNQGFQKEKQVNTYLNKINAGTYYVQLGRGRAPLRVSEANIYAYFGYLPSNTEFFSVDFVKSENNGKNVTFKLNTLDTLSKMVIDDSNGPGVRSFSTISVVGRECTVDKDGYFTIGLNEEDSGYCYLSVGIKDIFGNEFSKWYGIMTDYTTVVENIPATVEYTGKPITLKGLKVITGYEHNNCATYDVKYENNTDVGTAKVTITGNGNFIGSVTKTFKIVHTKHKNIEKVTKKPTYFNKGKKTTTCSVCGKISTSTVAKLKLKVPSVKITTKSKKIFVKYNKVTGAAGFEVRYKLTTSKKWITKIFKTSKSTTKFINNLKKDKKYNVGVRSFALSGSKKAYSLWSSSKTLKIK